MTTVSDKMSANCSAMFSTLTDYNFSIYDYPQTNSSLGNEFGWREGLKIITYLGLLILAVIGNILVILVVYFNQTMRSTINYYLVNLAIADFLIAVCCMWVHLVNLLTSTFVLGAFMCPFNAFAQMTTLTSSVLTLAVISCDRFLAVIFPLRVRLVQQRPSIVIGLIWCLAMAVSAPFLIYKEYQQINWKNFVECQCVERWPVRFEYSLELGACVATTPAKQIYYTFVTVALFFLPMLIMSATYCMIVWRLWVTQVPGERSDAAVTTQSRSKRKVVKMVFIILVVFIICWMPLQILILYNEFQHSRQQNGQLPSWFDDLKFFAYFIAYANSAINPIIYGGFNANYRQGIRAILRCTPRAHFQFTTRFQRGGTMTTTLTSSCRHQAPPPSSQQHHQTPSSNSPPNSTYNNNVKKAHIVCYKQRKPNHHHQSIAMKRIDT
ncbi:hypothetical protein CHUAL_007754 [Chamberlinius hualienensis]